MRTVLAATALSLSLVACSSDRPSASSNSGTGAAGLDAGTSDAATSIDGAVSPRPDLCQGLTSSAMVAEELSQAGPAAVSLGGTLVFGTYDAEELDIYGAFDAGAPDGGEGSPGVRATGRTVSGTLVLTKDTLQIVEAYGTPDESLGPPTTRAYAYVLKDKSLNAAEQCPMTAATQPIGYTVAGDALALFPDPNHREVYRLRP